MDTFIEEIAKICDTSKKVDRICVANSDEASFLVDKKIGMSAEEMCNRFINSMNLAFEKWQPKSRYILEEVK